MLRSWTAVATSVLATLTLAVFIGATPSLASSSAPCAPGIGTRVPVILVHGFNSGPDTWNTMYAAIKDKVPDAYVYRFDYSKYSLRWVSDSNIGPKLATTITCLADASRTAGGAGKVIMVDHSMGGLATRYAATMTPQAPEVTADLGLVITLGTPNTGSPLANDSEALLYGLCHDATVSVVAATCDYAVSSNLSSFQGMAKWWGRIANLPKLPGSVPIFGFAGDVTVTIPFFHSTISDTGTDLIVGEKSALWGQYVNGFGGTQVVYCSSAVSVHLFTHADCWHCQLTSNAQIVRKTVTMIERYIADVKKPVSLSSYVGTWYAHSTGLTVKGDGTGNLFYRNYAGCPLPGGISSFPMCNISLNIQLSANPQGAVATVTSSYAEGSSNGGSPTKGSSGISNGTTFKLGPVSGGEIRIDMTGVPNGNGVFNVCDPHHICGA